MSDTLLVALIGAGQAITLGLIGLLGVRLGRVKNDVGRVQKDTAASREQLQNSHQTNLREELDERHQETKSWIEDLESSVSGEFRKVGRDIGGIRQELRDDRRANHDARHTLDERLTTLERKDS